VPTPSSTVLSIEQDGAVATLWLDRADARNAMGRAFFDDLPVAMDALGADQSVRAVVLAGRGPCFSVGLDLKTMGGSLTAQPTAEPTDEVTGDTAAPGGARDPSPAARAAATRRSILRMQASVGSVAACPKPVIAAVHGWCIGGGVDLVTACDVRLASADAVFSVREARMAIVADLGTLQRLPGIVGRGHAAELALTGKDLTAARAKAIGLVNEVFGDTEALHAAARSMAAEMAALSPLAVQGTKAVLAAADSRSVAEGLDYVAAWNAGMLLSDDLVEALSAFAEKRPPRFTGR
jgi:enoyl-CoA hydratase